MSDVMAFATTVETLKHQASKCNVSQMQSHDTRVLHHNSSSHLLCNHACNMTHLLGVKPDQTINACCLQFM